MILVLPLLLVEQTAIESGVAITVFGYCLKYSPVFKRGAGLS